MTANRLPLLRKKIQNPAVSPRVLMRSPFYNWASEMAGCKLTAITAPAGYGKTTFLSCAAALLSGAESPAGDQENSPSIPHCRVAWYSLGNDDNTPAAFLAHLLESLDNAAPGLGVEAQRILYSVAEVSREYLLIVNQLCEELWSWEGQSENKQILLILDDFHLVDQAGPIRDIMERLLDQSPPFLQFCLAGRHRPAIRLQKFSLKYAVREIDFRDLSFSQDEIEGLLKDKYHLEITEVHASEITRQTEGWAAGVVMTAQILQGYSPRDYSEVLSSALKHREKIFTYFAEEAMLAQPPGTRDFLARASLLENLTAEACEVVLGLAGAAEKLEALHESGLFLAAVEAEGESAYRFHALFNSYLRKMLQQSYGPAVIGDMHRKAAGYYEGKKQLDTALEHLWAAGDPEQPVRLIKQYAQELLDRGYVEQVRRWLDRLPPARQDEDPYFLYLKGFIHQHSDQPLALSCFERAAAAFAKEGKKHLLVRCLIYMCTIYSLQNRVDKVSETSSRIPVASALALDPWARGVLVVSSLCQEAWNDNLRRAQWLVRLAQRFSLEPDWRWAMLAYSCMVYYRLGELNLARCSIEEALAMPVVYNNDVWRGMALVLYHVVLYSQDDEAGSEKVREELWEIGEKYDSFYYKAYAERSRAFPHLHQGEWEQAEEILRSSLYFFTRAGNEPMVLISRLDLARLDSCRGKAAQALGEAREAWRQLCALQCGQGLVEQGQSLLGIVAREAGELDLAEQMLLGSARVSKAKGARQFLAGTYLHLSLLYHQKGDEAKGDRYLQQALSLAESGGYIVFWDHHRPTVLKQCRKALDKQICPGYAARLLRYWFGDGEAETAATSQTTAEAQKTQQPRLPEVEIFCLGGFTVQVNGKPLPPQAWKTRKVQGLFKHLVLGGGKKTSREQLMDLFWPEADPRSAAASLRVTLSRLRKALDYYSEAGESATHLLGEGQGSLWLETADTLAVDIDHFTELLREANEHLARGDLEQGRSYLEKAREFYRGALFADDLYTEWIIPERERLEMSYLELLLSLGGLYSERLPGQAEELRQALECFKEALRLNPYREDIYLRLMKAYLAAGEKAEALRVYRRCREMLGQEFGLEPGPELQNLAGSINQ